MIEVYTDGACHPNPGAGGWAFVIINDGVEVGRHSGYEAKATNNTMELMAALKALQWIREYPGHAHDLEIVIYTDSQYLIQGITKWIKGWQRRGWMTHKSKKHPSQPVKNKELWQSLAHLISKKTKWVWVRGHNENYYNELCDQLAVAAKKGMKCQPASL